MSKMNTGVQFLLSNTPPEVLEWRVREFDASSYMEDGLNSSSQDGWHVFSTHVAMGKSEYGTTVIYVVVSFRLRSSE